MPAKINLKIQSDFEQASKDYKEFIDLNEDAAKRAKEFQDSFDTQKINKFLDQNKKTATAVKATSGELQAQRVEQSRLRKQIESLIKKGMDPLDDKLKPLTDRYQKLEKEIEDSTQAAKGNEKAFSLVDGVMLGLGTKALDLAQQGFQKLVEFTRESAQAAADAQEVMSKFSVVFGGVQDSANRTAEQLAEDFDLASSTAQKLLGDTGDLLTGFGLTEEAALELSEQTNRLAIDLASFTNAQGGAEAVSKALTSAYSGEREALKTYGIVINEAAVQARILENEQKGLTFASEQQAKAAATLQLAQEQSKNAIGDYSRTSESAANVQRRLGEQTKRLQENYGELVLQGLTPVRSAFANLLENLNDNIEATREFRKVMKAVREENAELVDIEQLRAQRDVLEERIDQYRDENGELKNLSNITRSIVDADQQRLEKINRIISQREIENEQAEKAAKVEKQQNDAEELADTKAQEAQMRLRDLEQERLSTGEKEIARLNDEIDKWADIREQIRGSGEDYSEVQAVINELVEQRNDKLEEQAQKELEQREKVRQAWADSTMRIKEHIEERRQAEIESAQAEFEKYNEIINARETNTIEYYNSVAEKAREAGVEEAEVQEWLTGKIIEYRKQQAQAAIDTAGQIMGIFSAVDQLRDAQAEAELQRMEEQGATEEEIAQRKKELARENAKREKKMALFEVAINTAAAIVEALPNLVLAGIAAATGAIQAAAIASQPIPSAQTGGEFEIPSTGGNRQDNVAVMAQEGETVSVTPRGEGGMMQNISVALDGDILISFINDKIESGEVRITADNIQGGISV